MSSPKHLWSATPAGGDSGDGPRRRFTPRLLAVTGLAVVLLAVGITLAATLGGSSKPKLSAQSQPIQPSVGGNTGTYTLPQITIAPKGATGSQGSQTPQQSTPQQNVPQQPSQSSVPTGPTYNWLGMEISDSTQGPTVTTVLPGSAAYDAGVDPGDVIASINGTSINSVSQLSADTAKLKLGGTFQLTVDRGSTPVTMSATLSGLPTKAS
jgi:membrane-associated protease RseP (regulator of RpoE activity)